VFQSFNLIDELTVFENVELPLLYQKVSPSDRKMTLPVHDLHPLQHFGLPSFSCQKGKTLLIQEREFRRFFEDCELINQIEALEHETDVVFPQVRSLPLGINFEISWSRNSIVRRKDVVEHSRFTLSNVDLPPGWSHESNELAGFHFKIDVVQRDVFNLFGRVKSS